MASASLIGGVNSKEQAANLVFSYFVADQNGTSFRGARQAAIDEGIEFIMSMADEGLSANDWLVVLYRARSEVVGKAREWISGMLDFVKLLKPILETAKNSFVPGGEDVVVTYDENLRCAFHLADSVIWGLGAPSAGIASHESVFAAAMRAPFLAACGEEGKHFYSVAWKLEEKKALDNSERMQLQKIFSALANCFFSLNQTFVGLSGEVQSSRSTVQIDEQALSAQATRLTAEQERALTRLKDKINSSPNYASFLR